MIQIYLVGCILSLIIHIKKTSNFKKWVIEKDSYLNNLLSPLDIKIKYEVDEKLLKASFCEGRRGDYLELIYQTHPHFRKSTWVESFIFSWLYVFTMTVNGEYKIRIDDDLRFIIEKLSEYGHESLYAKLLIYGYTRESIQDIEKLENIIKKEINVLKRKEVNSYSIALTESLYFYKILSFSEKRIIGKIDSSEIIKKEFEYYLSLWEALFDISLDYEILNELKNHLFKTFLSSLESISEYSRNKLGLLIDENEEELFDDKQGPISPTKSYREGIMHIFMAKLKPQNVTTVISNFIEDKNLELDDLRDFIKKKKYLFDEEEIKRQEDFETEKFLWQISNL